MTERKSNPINEQLNKIPIWKNLDPDKKKIVSVIAISIFFLVFMLAAYSAKTSKKEALKAEAPAEIKELNLDEGRIESTVQDLLLKSDKEKTKDFEDLKEEIKRLKERPQQLVVQKSPIVATSVKANHLIPPPPVPSNIDRKSSFDTSSFPQIPMMNEPVEWVGGISSTPVNVTSEKKNQKKGGMDSIYLPPSFVEATLLSGVKAPTSSEAKNNPVPLLFRIKDLAILPNRVKANLKGCFVIGEGTGNLATERIDCRIVTLSCVSKNGESVIDQKVKGWVEDDGDGTVGLDGTVVAKMGMHVARTTLAGFIGGFGKALSQSTQESVFTDAGNINSITSNQSMKNYTKAGFGEGIHEGSKDLKKFYLDLAESTRPVIEVLSTKAVTLVFSEGVELKIKEVNLGESK